MGNCLQALFRSNRSSLKHQTLLNYKQLTAMIKPSTRNDSLFYCSSNLSIMEQFLSQMKADTAVNTDFINKNLTILYAFIQDLKDRTSPIGRQYLSDQQRVYNYLQKQKQTKNINHREVKISDLIILRIQIQVILASVALIEIMEDKEDWDLVLEIEEVQSDNHKLESSIKEDIEPKIQLISRIDIGRYNNNQSNKKESYIEKPFQQPPTTNSQQSRVRINEPHQQRMKSNRKQTERIKKQYESQGSQLQQIPVFDFSSKTVLKTSKINFNLYKKKRITNIQSPTSPNKLKPRNKSDKDKILLGHTTLSVSDFIFYNSLVVSDVIPLQSPTYLKSSITTTASHTSNSYIIAFISLRGQGLKAQSLDKEYIKITKQHQTVAWQLNMCLQGDKAWEKLSQFRLSNASQKDQSLYSEYSMPQQGGNRYKI